MASSSTTPHYMLNSWSGTDKPTRADFVRDNLLIDTVIWQHESDINMHMTRDEKHRVQAPFDVKMIQGTDTASRTIEFNFSPKLVIYFAVGEPPVKVENGTTVVNCCVAAAGYGESASCALGTSSLIVEHGTSGSVNYNLNNSDCQYVAFAMR